VRAASFSVDNDTTTSVAESAAPSLDQQYTAALRSARETGNWQDAAEKLNGFNYEDIQERLAQLSDEEVGYLHLGALDNPRVGPQSQVAQMTAPGTPRASTAPPAVSQEPPRSAVPENAPAPEGQGKSISEMTDYDKLVEAYHRAKISQAFREKIESLITPTALAAAIIAFVVAFVASQFTPVGWAADIGLALTGIFIGAALFTAARHFIKFADARNATTTQELDQAGAEFAQGVAEIGVDAAILLVTHGMGAPLKVGLHLRGHRRPKSCLPQHLTDCSLRSQLTRSPQQLFLQEPPWGWV
jgi:hypothetical protein